jgi:hypothetical protein
LNRAAWYDLLAWQSVRFHKALDDTTSPEAINLSQFRDAYRNLANKIEGQPDLAPFATPQLSLIADSSEIYLARQDEKTKKLKLQVRSEVATEVWLIAEYDSQVLAVDGKGILRQEDLRRAARRAREAQTYGALYPYRPFNAPAIELQAKRPHDVELTVARLTDEAKDTKLILKAVSRDAYRRHEVDVRLPGTASFHLAVDGERNGLWDEREGAVVLHPLPNQPNDFKFKILNRTNVKKTLGVTFIVPQRAGAQAGAMPRGAPAAEEVKRILDEYGGNALVPTLTVELPESGEARVQLTPSGDQPPPLANLLPDPGAPEKPRKNLPHGLIVVIEDMGTKQKTLRRVLIEPQPPRLFLGAIANIDLAGNVAIRVWATNQAVIPDKGIRVAATIEGISDQFDSELAGVISAPTYSVELTGRIAANAPRQLTATVDVADYPRAFIFQIPRGSSRSIEPATGTKAVRIVSPQPEKAFKADPLAVVPVTLQVDAPHDAFLRGREAHVAVGIDSDRDRQLNDENIQPQRLYADRQVNVDATSFAPDGTITLDTRIEDISLSVTGNASNEPVWLLSQLRLPGEEPVSHRVQIMLDGSQPVIEDVRLSARTIEAGMDLDVIITASDLSPIVKVEAAFETSTAGNSNEGQPGWTPAQPGDGKWIAKLKTESLLPNTDHYVVVQATDETGHIAKKTMSRVRVVEKPTEGGQTADQLMQNKFADIEGVVLFKRTGLAAKVEFDPPLVPPIAPVETGEDGRFKFTKVPPGKHKLHARGQKNGYYRNATMDVEVPAGGSETPITVTLNAE